LEATGIAPFAYRFERSHTSAEALSLYDDAMGEDGSAIRRGGTHRELRCTARRRSSRCKTARDGSRSTCGRITSATRTTSSHIWTWTIRRRERPAVSDPDGEVTVRADRLVLLAVASGLPRGEDPGGRRAP
jgi:hypothetical protein